MPTSTHSRPGKVTISDIEAASERLKGHAVRTPLLEAPLLNDHVGRRLLVKSECLQVTGSFKFRGASNKILGLEAAERQKGVVAYSSGNHAQGVAAAAHYAGIPATIVMPHDAPEIKRRNTEAWGASVVGYDRVTEDRIAIAKAVAEEDGAVLVPPYDDPWIIAGQGTVGLELTQQLAEIDVVPEAVVIPCGGGGLTAGVCLAMEHGLPNTKRYIAEPEYYSDTIRSLSSGVREAITPNENSILDALLSLSPGEITFDINKHLLAGGFAVSDTEALQAMRVAFTTLKLVVEPGGAAGLAAILSGKLPPGDGPVVAVLSGGNVDHAIFERALSI